MGRVLWASLFCCFLGTLQAGQTLRIFGNGFSFLVTEPEGWVIDVESAAQLANFVAHEKGKTWREAELVIFARFIDKAPQETLGNFVNLDVDRFEEACPFFEIRDLALQVSGAQKFQAREYTCPGYRSEVVAFTEVPGRFAVFVLSAKRREPLAAGLTPFQDLVSSFQWLDDPGWKFRRRPQESDLPPVPPRQRRPTP